MKILIVDDEPAIADTLAYALSAEGCATDCCALGREAVEWTRTRDYALVILDVGLPDMSGFDVCRALRRHSEAPVIFLTARAEEVDHVVGLELGADDYVSPSPSVCANWSPACAPSCAARAAMVMAARSPRCSRWIARACVSPARGDGSISPVTNTCCSPVCSNVRGGYIPAPR
ncbi:MAG: response regulator [Zoogloeaceae bacterium]|nr:response regulator [Zoogloeaceae bacterium]